MKSVEEPTEQQKEEHYVARVSGNINRFFTRNPINRRLYRANQDKALMRDFFTFLAV